MHVDNKKDISYAPFFCFSIQGPEKHQFLAPLSEESSLEGVGMGSVYEKKPVVGDLTAEPVLESLLYIAQLYGEPVLTYQYLPYIGYLVNENIPMVVFIHDLNQSLLYSIGWGIPFHGGKVLG